MKGLSEREKGTRLAPKVQNSTQRVRNYHKTFKRCELYKFYESLIAFTKSGV